VPERVYGGLLKASWRDLVFEPFREGIAVHWLVKGSASEPSAALLRYDPGASVPSHRHGGLETILVLEGSQSDEKGDYEAGTLVLNAKGTEHSVHSKNGCVVFIQWDLPVIMLGDGK
jgi:anti-sigma factor ChrR (cupin superfamily)